MYIRLLGKLKNSGDNWDPLIGAGDERTTARRGHYSSQKPYWELQKASRSEYQQDLRPEITATYVSGMYYGSDNVRSRLCFFSLFCFQTVGMDLILDAET